MQKIHLPKGDTSPMRKYVILGLGSIIFLAVLLRLMPLTKYEFWGIDTGEYYGISNALKVYGHLDPTGYNGFGFTYPYFPGLYLFISSTSIVTSLELYTVFSILIPIIGALSILFVFLISHTIFKDPKASLMASLFVAVIVVHVYQTSRTMPATLGHFLLILCLLLLLKMYDDKRYFALLVPATIALVATHHLSVYFLIIASFGMVFYREILIKKNKCYSISGISYLLFLISVTMVYWFTIATPFIKDVIAPAFRVPVIILPILLYVGVLFIYIWGRLRRIKSINYIPRYRGLDWSLQLYGLAISLGIIVLSYLTIIGISGVSVEDRLLMLEFLPIIILLGFIGFGISRADLYRKGFAIYGWIIGIGISFLVTIAINRHEIFPDRHAEVLIVILAIFMGLGMVKLFELRSMIRSFKNQCMAFGIIIVLFIAVAFTAYPPTSVMGGGEQGSYTKDMAGVYWMRSNIYLKEESIVASENRLSSDLYGIGNLNSSWYSAKDTFYASNFSNAQSEMLHCNSPSGKKRIDYIFMDKPMIDNAILTPWENHDSIRGNALQKFDSIPYIRLFDNGYCVLYVVNWKY